MSNYYNLSALMDEERKKVYQAINRRRRIEALKEWMYGIAAFIFAYVLGVFLAIAFM